MRQLLLGFILTFAANISNTFAYDQNLPDLIEVGDTLTVNLPRKLDGNNGTLVYRDENGANFCLFIQARPGYIWLFADAESKFEINSVIKNQAENIYYQLNKLSGAGEEKLYLFCQNLTPISDINNFLSSENESIVTIMKKVK